MASSIESVGKRCAAMEQGHRDLESHFVDFMPGSLAVQRRRRRGPGDFWDGNVWLKKEPQNL